jgi:hypothetical protein
MVVLMNGCRFVAIAGSPTVESASGGQIRGKLCAHVCMPERAIEERAMKNKEGGMGGKRTGGKKKAGKKR